jgi:hypothetical protein
MDQTVSDIECPAMRREVLTSLAETAETDSQRRAWIDVDDAVGASRPT